ncbi:MAG: hypothetical protein AABZ61_13390 [Bacteroidota bacterium]
MNIALNLSHESPIEGLRIRREACGAWKRSLRYPYPVGHCFVRNEMVLFEVLRPICELRSSRSPDLDGLCWSARLSRRDIFGAASRATMNCLTPTIDSGRGVLSRSGDLENRTGLRKMALARPISRA